MSKLGKLPVVIPAGVTVTVADCVVTVKGPKGELKQDFSKDIKVEVKDGNVIVTPLNGEKQTGAFHGLYRNLINNMVVGVTTGFTKTLVITGVGYRAEVQGKMLMLNLGYSTDFYVVIPEGLTVTERVSATIMKLSDVKSVRLVLNKVERYV